LLTCACEVFIQLIPVEVPRSCYPISIVSISSRRRNPEWGSHVIFQSRLQIDTFPEDFAKSTKSNFSWVFRTRSRWESMRNFRYHHWHGSTRRINRTWRKLRPYICMQETLEARNEHIAFTQLSCVRCECPHDRHCLLLKRPSTIIAIIENRAFTVTDLWRVCRVLGAIQWYQT